MSNQVVTIGYLKSFVKGFLTVTTSQLDSYCPTYSELTNGSIVRKFINNDVPLSVTNGVYVNPQFTNGVNYGSNQLVKREHLMVKFVELVSILTVANKKNLSCCGDNATLTTTASFDYKTKNENGIVVDRKGVIQNVSAKYTESVSYASINGNVVNVSKNAVNYPNNASSRAFTVSSSYNYVFGGEKTSSVSITQNANTIGNWINTTQDTTSITISPTSFNFTIQGGNISYVTTRVYTQNMKKVDSCNVTVATNSVPNQTMKVTPTSFTSNNPAFTVTANQVSVAKQGSSSAEKNAIITISYDGKSVTANANQPATSISGWEKEGDRYSFTLSVKLSPSGSLACNGGTTQATATYGWKQNYVKKDSFGVVVEREIRYESSNVTSSTAWSTTRGSVNSSGVVTYPKSDSTSTITTTVTGKYSGLSANASFTQENCVQCHNEYTYDMKVLPVSIGCCETSAKPVVQGRKHTQYVCTDGTSEDKGWTNFTNLSSNEYSITINPSISSNETSSVKTYKIIASGKGVYNGLSATSTVTQAAGPCTTYETEVQVNESIPYSKSIGKCATTKDVVFPTMKGRYKVCKNGVCGSFSAWENLKEGTDYYWLNKDSLITQNETSSYRNIYLPFRGMGKYKGDSFETYGLSIYQEAGPCHPTCTEGWYLVKEDKKTPVLTIYDSPKITIPAIGVKNGNPVKLNGGKLNQTINRNYEWRNTDCSLNKQKTSATTENVLLKEYTNTELNYTSHNVLFVTPKDGYIIFCAENENTYNINHTLTGSVTYNGVSYQDTTIISQNAAHEEWVTNVKPNSLTFSKKGETKYVTVNWEKKLNGKVVKTIYPESYWLEDESNPQQLNVQYVDSSIGKFSVKFGNPDSEDKEPFINFCKPGNTKPARDASVQCYFTGQYCSPSYDYSNATLSFECDSSMTYDQTKANVKNVKMTGVIYTNSNCVTSTTEVALSSSQYTESYSPSGTNTGTTDRTVTVTVTSDSSHGSKSASKSITQSHKPKDPVITYKSQRRPENGKYTSITYDKCGEDITSKLNALVFEGRYQTYTDGVLTKDWTPWTKLTQYVEYEFQNKQSLIDGAKEPNESKESALILFGLRGIGTIYTGCENDKDGFRMWQDAGPCHPKYEEGYILDYSDTPKFELTTEDLTFKGDASDAVPYKQELMIGKPINTVYAKKTVTNHYIWQNSDGSTDSSKTKIEDTITDIHTITYNDFNSKKIKQTSFTTNDNNIEQNPNFVMLEPYNGKETHTTSGAFFVIGIFGTNAEKNPFTDKERTFDYGLSYTHSDGNTYTGTLHIRQEASKPIGYTYLMTCDKGNVLRMNAGESKYVQIYLEKFKNDDTDYSNPIAKYYPYKGIDKNDDVTVSNLSSYGYCIINVSDFPKYGGTHIVDFYFKTDEGEKVNYIEVYINK